MVESTFVALFQKCFHFLQTWQMFEINIIFDQLWQDTKKKLKLKLCYLL